MKSYSKIISVVWVIIGVALLGFGAYVHYTENLASAGVHYAFAVVCFTQFIIRKKFIEKRLNR
jgi:hypothetical protein